MTASLQLKGVFPIVATPFSSDGAVDTVSLAKLIDWLAAQGCDALTMFGIAGEYYKLTDAERQQMAEIMVERCQANGVPSILSVTDHSWQVAAKTAQRYEALGADALMLLPPFFMKPSAAEIEEHIRQVGKAVTIPIMLQYAPEQTGVGIPPPVFAAIARDLPNIRDFKIECRPVGHYITRLLEMTDGAVRVHVGNAGFNLIEAYQRGAVGMMPGCSMIDLYLQLQKSLEKKDWPRAHTIHLPLVGLLNHIRQSVEMIVAFEKQILKRRGIIEHATCRTPTYVIDKFDQDLFEVLYSAIAGSN